MRSNVYCFLTNRIHRTRSVFRRGTNIPRDRWISSKSHQRSCGGAMFSTSRSKHRFGIDELATCHLPDGRGRHKTLSSSYHAKDPVVWYFWRFIFVTNRGVSIMICRCHQSYVFDCLLFTFNLSFSLFCWYFYCDRRAIYDYAKRESSLNFLKKWSKYVFCMILRCFTEIYIKNIQIHITGNQILKRHFYIFFFPS